MARLERLSDQSCQESFVDLMQEEMYKFYVFKGILNLLKVNMMSGFICLFNLCGSYSPPLAA